jgi:hypothetical protein
VPWSDVAAHLDGPVPATRDGYLRHACGDERLLAAYRDVRREAATGAALTPRLTARWNSIVRGVPAAAFRRGTAVAKNGRERYGLHAVTQQRFASCLTDTADPATPVTARAARAYRDVAFFHPYDDGNGRLAGLVLLFVLLRERVELDEVTPILTTIRRADDADGAADLARLVYGIAAATRRRHLRESALTKGMQQPILTHQATMTGLLSWRRPCAGDLPSRDGR